MTMNTHQQRYLMKRIDQIIKEKLSEVWEKRGKIRHEHNYEGMTQATVLAGIIEGKYKLIKPGRAFDGSLQIKVGPRPSHELACKFQKMGLTGWYDLSRTKAACRAMQKMDAAHNELVKHGTKCKDELVLGDSDVAKTMLEQLEAYEV